MSRDEIKFHVASHVDNRIITTYLFDERARRLHIALELFGTSAAQSSMASLKKKLRHPKPLNVMVIKSEGGKYMAAKKKAAKKPAAKKKAAKKKK